MPDDRKIYQVSEITRHIKSTLEKTFGTVWIEGEITNFRRPASGHCYFTLKDERAQISAVLFRGNQRGMKFEPASGVLVQAYGEITVYEPGGNYQILVRKLEEGGKGSLQAQFEELKEKLDKEGLFGPEQKKPLPLLPQRLGIVTSPTGAAIRDILNVLQRRFPNLRIVIAPVRVQGEGAATEIAQAIEDLNRLGDLDALIVGRGGGSLEDLWCFNEEVVARAIAKSELPVISAVGHEIDVTISDFVADLRAPTPSAAAELVVGRKDTFEEHLVVQLESLVSVLRERMLRERNRLLAARGSEGMRDPRALIGQYMQKIDSLAVRMEHSLSGAVRDGSARLEALLMRARHLLEVQVSTGSQDIRRLSAQLRALNPLGVLQRGYSVTLDAEQNILSDVKKAKLGDKLTTRLASGSIDSEIIEIRDGE